jgi:kynurenine formamidase
LKAIVTLDDQNYEVDFSKPLDISIPLVNSSRNPVAWYLDKPVIEPVVTEDWIGAVAKGAAINFNNIQFNPHAHGTHTESVGHISETVHSVNKALQTYFFRAEVISVAPELRNGDEVISAKQLRGILKGKSPEALVIRTLPNTTSKKTHKYSNTNWPYLEEAAAKYIRELGVDHLLIDLPSVDKEKDEGKLLAHRAFWNYPKHTRMHATITEFVYVSNRIMDGSYLLNLQTAPFVNDASPSRPVLYKINDR